NRRRRPRRPYRPRGPSPSGSRCPCCLRRARGHPAASRRPTPTRAPIVPAPATRVRTAEAGRRLAGRRPARRTPARRAPPPRTPTRRWTPTPGRAPTSARLPTPVRTPTPGRAHRPARTPMPGRTATTPAATPPINPATTPPPRPVTPPSPSARRRPGRPSPAVRPHRLRTDRRQHGERAGGLAQSQLQRAGGVQGPAAVRWDEPLQAPGGPVRRGNGDPGTRADVPHAEADPLAHRVGRQEEAHPAGRDVHQRGSRRLQRVVPQDVQGEQPETVGH